MGRPCGLSLVMSKWAWSVSREQFLHCGLRKFHLSKSSVYRWYTQLDRRRFVYDTWDSGSRLGRVMVECTLSIVHCLRLNLQLYTIDLVRTCRISSFCTVLWQLARFQLTRCIVRSLGDSEASCIMWLLYEVMYRTSILIVLSTFNVFCLYMLHFNNFISLIENDDDDFLPCGYVTGLYFVFCCLRCWQSLQSGSAVVVFVLPMSVSSFYSQLYSVRKNFYTLEIVWSRWKFWSKVLHTCCMFVSMLCYKILFSYL